VSNYFSIRETLNWAVVSWENNGVPGMAGDHPKSLGSATIASIKITLRESLPLTLDNILNVAHLCFAQSGTINKDETIKEVCADGEMELSTSTTLFLTEDQTRDILIANWKNPPPKV